MLEQSDRIHGLAQQSDRAESTALQNLTVGPNPRSLLALTAVDAELVGGWGLSITWSDGHSTGIFAWSILRAWQTPEPAPEPAPAPAGDE